MFFLHTTHTAFTFNKYCVQCGYMITNVIKLLFKCKGLSLIQNMHQLTGTDVRDTVLLDVGGTLFKCFSKTLLTFPDSKLANLGIWEHFSLLQDSSKVYFFDRNPLLFCAILDAYRKGSVHIPKDTCGKTFREELEFWEVSPSHVAPCCWGTLYGSDHEIDVMERLAREIIGDSNTTLQATEIKTLSQKIWLILDEPKSSKFASAWGVLIFLLVVTSVLLTCLQTLPMKVVVFLIGLLVSVFGFFMYIAELTYNDKINNAFSSMYWALITLTTVGYGDMTPETTAGHIVATICALSGVIMLALPIGVIASTFNTFYNYFQCAETHVRLYKGHGQCQKVTRETCVTGTSTTPITRIQ